MYSSLYIRIEEAELGIYILYRAFKPQFVLDGSMWMSYILNTR